MTVDAVVAAPGVDRARACSRLGGSAGAGVRAPDRARRRGVRRVRRDRHRLRRHRRGRGHRHRRRALGLRRPPAAGGGRHPRTSESSRQSARDPGRRRRRPDDLLRTAVDAGPRRRRAPRSRSAGTGGTTGIVVVADTVKPTSAEAIARAPRPRPDADPAHRRQRGGRPHGRRPRSASSTSSPTCCPPTRSTWSSACRTRGGSSRWSATASTTRPPSPRPTSGSRWAPAPTWPSRPAT